MRPASKASRTCVPRSKVHQVLGRSRDKVATSTARDLAGFERAALESAFSELGYEKFRARQVFGWIHRRGVTAIDAMTNLPRDLRAALAAEFSCSTPEIVSRECSADGT